MLANKPNQAHELERKVESITGREINTKFDDTPEIKQLKELNGSIKDLIKLSTAQAKKVDGAKNVNTMPKYNRPMHEETFSLTHARDLAKNVHVNVAGLKKKKGFFLKTTNHTNARITSELQTLMGQIQVDGLSDGERWGYLKNYIHSRAGDRDALAALLTSTTGSSSESRVSREIMSALKDHKSATGKYTSLGITTAGDPMLNSSIKRLSAMEKHTINGVHTLKVNKIPVTRKLRQSETDYFKQVHTGAKNYINRLSNKNPLFRNQRLINEAKMIVAYTTYRGKLIPRGAREKMTTVLNRLKASDREFYRAILAGRGVPLRVKAP